MFYNSMRFTCHIVLWCLPCSAGGLPSGVLQVVGDRVQAHQVPLAGHRLRLLPAPREHEMDALGRHGARVQARP